MALRCITKLALGLAGQSGQLVQVGFHVLFTIPCLRVLALWLQGVEIFIHFLIFRRQLLAGKEEKYPFFLGTQIKNFYLHDYIS